MEIQLEIAHMAIMPSFLESLVLLKKAGVKTEEVFLIKTDQEAALAIVEGMVKKQGPLPLAHDLLKNCIEALGGVVQKVVIGEFKDGISRSSIYIDCGNKIVLPIDSRLSDALAVAVRAQCPIYMEERVFEEGKIRPPTEEEMKQQKLKELLEFLKNADPKKLPRA